MRKIFLCQALLFLSGTICCAQDPHFSQFFMAPQLINPATSGTGSGDWRFVSNYRQQWANAGTPFYTITASGDIKITGREPGKDIIGLNVNVMSDQSLQGAFKSTYVSIGSAWHKQLNQNHRLGVGFQGNYGNRSIDYSKLSFGEQFSSGGFNVALPSGETALSNMKSFFSYGAGLLYNYHSEYLNLDIGAGGFNLNKPKQTFINDPNQFLSPRYVVHFNMEYEVSDKLLLNMNTIYQQQSSQQYFTVGGAVGLDLVEKERRKMIFAGAWYRTGDAIYPYLGLLFNHMQLGFSYDITTSKQNKGPNSPQSFEVSLVIKQLKSIPDGIPCPWK